MRHLSWPRVAVYVAAVAAVVILGVTGTVDGTAEMLALLVGIAVPSPITDPTSRTPGP